MRSFPKTQDIFMLLFSIPFLITPSRNILRYQAKVIGILIFATLINFLAANNNWAKSVQEKQALLFSIHQPENTQIYRWMYLVYNDLFSRLDMSVTLVYLPPKRATAYARLGKIDGQVGRMASYAEEVGNQIKVNETIYSLDMVAYVRRSANLKHFEGWKSLANKGLKVDYLRGIAIAVKNLTPLITPTDLKMVDTLKQGFLRIKEGRVDVFVASNHSAEPILSSFEYKEDISHGGVLESVGFYPHLHVRFRELVPLIANAIKEMKKEGLIDKYQQQALK